MSCIWTLLVEIISMRLGKEFWFSHLLHQLAVLARVDAPFGTSPATRPLWINTEQRLHMQCRPVCSLFCVASFVGGMHLWQIVCKWLRCLSGCCTVTVWWLHYFVYTFFAVWWQLYYVYTFLCDCSVELPYLSIVDQQSIVPPPKKISLVHKTCGSNEVQETFNRNILYFSRLNKVTRQVFKSASTKNFILRV